MTIGELASAAGVPAPTVRYYEQRGLLAPAPRTRSGYRVYDADAVRRLRFIRHAQALGFTLEDVQQLLALRVTGPASCKRVGATTREQLERVRARIRELRRMEAVLDGLLDACASRAATEECPVLAALSDQAPRATASPPSTRRARARAGTVSRARGRRHA